VITFVQVVLLLGGLLGGAYAFEAFEKNQVAVGAWSGTFALLGLASVVTLELLIKRE
jgi:hypothetical protein